MRTSGSGYTLVEAVVGFAVLVTLMSMMFLIFRQGANAWKKGETQSEMLREAQLLTSRLSREVERSLFAAVALDPGPSSGTAVSFPGNWNSTDARYEYDSSARSPVWQQHIIYYHQASDQTVRRVEHALSPPTTSVSSLTGLSGLRNGGQKTAKWVVACDFEMTSPILRCRFVLERDRYGSAGPERLEFGSSSYFRN